MLNGIFNYFEKFQIFYLFIKGNGKHYSMLPKSKRNLQKLKWKRKLHGAGTARKVVGR